MIISTRLIRSYVNGDHKSSVIWKVSITTAFVVSSLLLLSFYHHDRNKFSNDVAIKVDASPIIPEPERDKTILIWTAPKDTSFGE